MSKKSEKVDADVVVFDKVEARANKASKYLTGVQIGEHCVETMREKNGSTPRYTMRVTGLTSDEVTTLADALAGTAAVPAKEELESEETLPFESEPATVETAATEAADDEPTEEVGEASEATPEVETSEEPAADASEESELKTADVAACKTVDELLALLMAYDEEADDMTLMGYLKQVKSIAPCLKGKRTSALKKAVDAALAEEE